ncbi:hypothetical protein JDFnp4_143 [Fusobacterium phage JD-Fnp4]|nr:hypothetical protein JDFnp4_143 [Fusobacterium phage JD-Fnp4]
MSIFGRGYPFTEMTKQGMLDTNDIPANIKLRNIAKYKNVLSRAHLKMILQDTESELSFIISGILGLDIRSIKLIRKEQLTSSYKNDEIKCGLDIYIDGDDLRMYINPARNTCIQPFSLASEALHHINKSEYEAIYYCKFDETPITRTRFDTDKIYKPSAESRRIYDDCMDDNWKRGYFHSTTQYHAHNSIDLLNDCLYKGFVYNNQKEYPQIEVPNVRVNEWLIPLFTDVFLNSQMYVDGLDVQIDFMPNPFKHINANTISLINGPNVRTGDTGYCYARHDMNLHNPHNDGTPNFSHWTKGTHHTGAGMWININGNYTPYYDRNDANFIQEFLLNKRADRHMRYKISAATCFREDLEGTRPAEYVEVEKVYDSEADIPMSCGFISGKSSYSFREHLQCLTRCEGIHPDPEDLTNPMDLAVDFIFCQCDSYEVLSPGGGLSTIEREHTHTINGKPCSLFGYLVIRGYSGLVGSTLQDGSFEKLKRDQVYDGSDAVTSYNNATRAHDTFFKVTIRTPKGITIVGGNCDDIDKREVMGSERKFADRILPYHDRGIGVSGHLFPIPTTLETDSFDDIGLDSVAGGIYPELTRAYTRHPRDIVSGYPFNYSDKNGYHVSKDLVWGSEEFYKYRIRDKGGFLRMPIQDYLEWNFMFHRRLFDNVLDVTQQGSPRAFKGFSGYLNPLTSALDFYFYKYGGLKAKLEGKNIGGQEMKEKAAQF